MCVCVLRERTTSWQLHHIVQLLYSSMHKQKTELLEIMSYCNLKYPPELPNLILIQTLCANTQWPTRPNPTLAATLIQ